jgi:hypothetical protein
MQNFTLISNPLKKFYKENLQKKVILWRKYAIFQSFTHVHQNVWLITFFGEI